jgi:hypothetical protein
MSHPQQGEAVAPWVENAGRAIRGAYPDGVPAGEFLPLVYLLTESMGLRVVAKVLDYAGLREYPLGYHDALCVVDQTEKYAAAAQPIREKLTRQGYDPTLGE